jgi:hypothetical protein
MPRRLSPLVTAFSFVASSAAAQRATPAPAPVGAAWQQDVRVIARELPARHPNLFYRLTRAQWDSAVTATEKRIAALPRTQAVVALMELVALAHDGHTSINPLFDRAFGARTYGVELYRFDDGMFVRSAAPEYPSLAGAKVLRIGRVNVDSALAAAARIISHENEWWTRAWAPMWLSIAELDDGLGLVEDMEAVPLVVERAGRRETVTLRPVAKLEPAGHGPGGPLNRTGWADMRAGDATPLWLRNSGRPYWVEFQPSDSTLYVCYRAVVTMGPPNTNDAFWRRVFALADSAPVRRMVLDIRENGGGNSFFNKQVVRGIVSRPALDRSDRLFVVIGSRTFSAAMNLARDLEQWTNATFVGEPTGNAAFFFGDAQRFPLPASGLTVNVSSLTWPGYDPRDRRPFLAPAIYTPLTSTDYRANVDPAMRAILARGTTPSLAARVEAAVRRGDTLAAADLVTAAQRDPANRFRSPEPDINALGYQLLNAGDRNTAILVFRINTRVFAQSANTWDSLGEALLTAGNREDAIAAYRHALAIDSSFMPSRRVLESLGVAPR